MDEGKIIDMTAILTDRDPGDETDTALSFEDGVELIGGDLEDPETLEFPADDEGGVIEVTIEEILAGFAQGMEILRLGILELDRRLTAVEESLTPEETEPSDEG